MQLPYHIKQRTCNVKASPRVVAPNTEEARPSPSGFCSPLENIPTSWRYKDERTSTFFASTTLDSTPKIKMLSPSFSTGILKTEKTSFYSFSVQIPVSSTSETCLLCSPRKAASNRAHTKCLCKPKEILISAAVLSFT